MGETLESGSSARPSRGSEAAGVDQRLVAFALVLSILLIGTAGVWLSTDSPARAPSSGFAPEAFLPPVPAGSALCVPREVVPAGAKAVQLTVGSNGRRAGTSVTVTGRRAEVTVLRGSRRFPEGQNFLIPLDRAATSEQVVTFCIKNTGRYDLRVGGKPGLGPSIRYPGATTTTWVRSAGSIADRFRFVRFAPLGTATLWIFLALALGAVVLAVATVIRAARP